MAKSKGSGLAGGGVQIGVNASLTGSNGPAGSEIGVNASVTNAVGGGAPPVEPAAATEETNGKPTINASTMTEAEWKEKYNAQNPNTSQKHASYDYTYPYAGPSGYSPSQDMNYKLDMGMPLNAKEQNMLQGMTEMSSPLGKDTLLYRGAHADAMSQLGVSNWNNMSAAQLKDALVGAEWTKASLTSTSYDYEKSPFLSGPQSGGREVIFNMHVAGSTLATAVNPSQAEVVLGQNTKWRIVDANFTGKWAHPKAGGSYKQIVLDVEVWQ